MLLSKDDINDLIRIRHEIHQHPEPDFRVHETRKRVVAELVRLGYSESDVVTYADPGFAVDIVGTGPDAEIPRTLLLRTELD
jgi:metal-dependent amidase/aminoacylase/carboxypeptidase family protein